MKQEKESDLPPRVMVKVSEILQIPAHQISNPGCRVGGRGTHKALEMGCVRKGTPFVLP